MPYADREVRAKYKLAHSRLPAQRERQAAARSRPGYREYMNPLRRRHMLKRYGLTSDGYEALLDSQGGLCALCRTDCPNNGKGDRYFDVDHDHGTGKVRGLLCRQCNLAVGVIERNLPRLRQVGEYLGVKVEFDPK